MVSSSSIIGFSIMGAFIFLAGGYIILSTVFFYYPIRKVKNNKRVRHKKPFYSISHRGGAGENVENTISAFDHSVSLNIDMFELDCHLTKDGQVVVCHDNDLLRLTGFNYKINETDYNQLPNILVNATKEQPTFGIMSNNQSNETLLKNNDVNDITKSSKNSIPLLESIFIKYPNVPINLDVKVNDDELIQKINTLIKKYDREDLIIWGSFNHRTQQKLLNINPNVPVFFSAKDCLKLLLGVMTGYLPFMSLNAPYLEIVFPKAALKKFSNVIPFYLRFALRLLQLLIMRKSVISHLKKRGITIFLWTLDSEEDFKQALDLGVNGIMTDYPTRLKNFLGSSTEYSNLNEDDKTS